MDAKKPQYRKLSPIGYWISWLLVPFNLILSYYLWLHPFEPLHWVWGGLDVWPIAFMLLSLYLVWALLRNDMKRIRYAMMAGVFLKGIWAWTLVVIDINIGFTVGLYLLDLWFFVLLTQMVVAIFTPPRVDYGLLYK